MTNDKNEERRAFERCMSDEDWRPVYDLLNEIDRWINKNTGRVVSDFDAYEEWMWTGQAPIAF